MRIIISSQVTVKHRSGTKSTDIESPRTQENVKRVVRKSYSALTSSVVQSSRTSDKVLTELGRKIKNEIKFICSYEHDSILNDGHEGVKHFSWETVWLELLLNVPTLMKLLCCLVNKPEDKKPLFCTIVAMILKNRRNSMALVQRAVSVVLYGNGVGKKVQIYMNF